MVNLWLDISNFIWFNAVTPLEHHREQVFLGGRSRWKAGIAVRISQLAFKRAGDC